MEGIDSSLQAPERPAAGAPQGQPSRRMKPRAEDAPLLSHAARAVAMEKVASPIFPAVLSGALRLGEFALLVVLGIAVFFAYVHPADAGAIAAYGTISLLGAAVAIIIFQAFELYNLSALRTYVFQGGRLGAAWTMVFALLLAGVFFSKLGDDVSRVWTASWYVSGLVLLMGGRWILASQVRRWTREGRLERRAVIVGGGEMGRQLIEALNASKNTDIRICGIFDDRGAERSPPVLAGYPKLGTVAELVEFSRLTRIDLLIVALPLSAETRLLELLKKLWVLPVDIRLSAHTNKLRFRSRSYSYIGNVPFLDVADKPIADWDYAVKCMFDRFVGTLLLACALPVMALVALAIRLDSKGPVLFRQKRYGFNNEVIDIYKFRSMYVEQSDARAARLVTRDDPRVTRVGRFIRRTSLDELPQLINVVKGQLSLVGPRPHAFHAKAENRLYDQVVDGYFARHRVKPGITGWAQINGWRGETDTQEKIQRRVEHDLFYIENWSVLFDIHILAMTPLSLITTKNAY